MYRRILILTGICLSVWGYSQKAMTEAESRDFLSQLAKDSKKIQTLQTDFTQTKKVKLLSKPIVSLGKMNFQAPNMLSWQYTSPHHQGFVFKENKIYVREKGKKYSVDTQNKMFEKLSQLIVGSVSGHIFSNSDFQASFFQEGNMKIVRLVPKPRQLQRFVKQVEIYFKNQNMTASKVIMTEKTGDTTEIEFSNTQQNITLPASVFGN